MAATPPAARDSRPAADDWRVIVAIFWVTSMVEGLGVSQIFAFVPLYLREMGVTEADRLRFVGIFGSLIFIVGAPLVPLWGVWADKYSRKAVIVRSALVEAVVFAGVALSREPWQLALSMLLVGFQLGNTGVMLASIRDVSPLVRLGAIIAIFGSAGPIGMAIGPAIGGFMLDRLQVSVSAIFWLSALLSVGTALLVWFGSREVRPTVVPRGRVVPLAYGAVRAVLTDRAVRRVFAIFGVAFLASQMSRPFVPILVERVNGDVGLASAIALVVGVAALVGALVSPLGGWIGDRVGFRPVLIAALLGGAVASFLMPVVGSVAALATVAVGVAAFSAAISAMVFSLLALEVPAERRSATLNLVYLPLYAAGIIGPIVGAIVVGAGLWAPFWLGAAIYLAGAIVLASRRSMNAGEVAVT